METFGAASHGEVLQLVIQIAALIAAARLMGGLARRLGQPTVVGEILAGVVLGPSMLSGAVPAIGEWIIPQTEVQGHLLEVVALIGVMLLLVVTGLETDLMLIKRRFRVSLGVSAGGLSVTFAAGLLLGYRLPDDLLADPTQRTVFALFVATALSISAIPVLAKVLIDLGLMRRDIGQTMLASGMIDDIVGWTMLGLVTALAGAESFGPDTVAMTAATVVVFVVVTATVGRWMLDRAMHLVQHRLRAADSELTLVVVLAFAWGGFSQWLNLEPVIGAFAVGILFGRLPSLPANAIAKLETMAMSLFAPVFFAVAGLKVDVKAVLEPRMLGFTILVIAVATFGKTFGAYAGARLFSGQEHWRALAYGSGLNARGALEIIVATIGLSVGILSSEMFSIIVIMAVATSVMAPVALRLTLTRVAPIAEEEMRIAREDALRKTFTAGVQRLLIPVRPRTGVVATQVIQSVISKRLGSAHGTVTTLLAVPDEASRGMASDYLTTLRSVFDSPETTTRVVASERPAEVILAEAVYHDVLMVGTPSMSANGEALFGELIDSLVRYAPCPTIIVRGQELALDWQPRRIVVPTSGSPSSRRALDLALAIAGEDASVSAFHVVRPSITSGVRERAFDITAETEVIATKIHHSISTRVIEADDIEQGILAEIADSGADLLVLGTSVRAGSTRLHLGPRVEYLARHSVCPVVIVNA